MNIIGSDLHSASFINAVRYEDGREVCFSRRETSEENLIEEVNKVPGEKWLVVEESHLAQWAKLVLEKHVNKLTICDPRENRLIAKADFNDDVTSAKKLTELAFHGKLKEVYHPDGMGELRSLFLHYYDLNGQIREYKAKLKATYRQVALPSRGLSIYEEKNRGEWLGKLQKYPHLKVRAENFFTLMDSVQEAKDKTYREMVRRAKKMPAFDRLLTIPGVGEVTATGYIAIIVTPHRFSHKNKLWKYAHHSVRRHESDGVVYDEGKSVSGNRALSWLLKQTYHHAVVVSKKTNRFKRKRQEVLARGVSKAAARQTVERSILSVVRAVWMKGEAYRE